MKKRVFVGSSSEKLDVARAIEANLDRDHEVTVWDEGIFALSHDILSGLINRLDRCDAAVFVLAPDDFTVARQTSATTVRDNVIFELGLFIGRLGRDRTYFVVPRGQTTLRLPSDLLGLVPAEYDASRSDGNLSAAVSPACTKIRDAIRAIAHQTTEDSKADVLADGLAWMQRYVNKAFSTLLQESSLSLPAATDVERGPRAFHTRIQRIAVTVQCGNICDFEARGAGEVVALPANEFFDDECIRDDRSALGAYIQRCYPGRTAEIQALIAQRLSRAHSELVECEADDYRKSFGVANCVLLEDALGSGRRLMFVSVTTKRSGVGLRSESRYLFAAMKAICKAMNDRRLTDLFVPIFGSGHGGLEKELALLFMLLSIKAVAEDSTSSAHLRKVTIVVFAADETSWGVDPAVVDRILSIVRRAS